MNGGLRDPVVVARPICFTQLEAAPRLSYDFLLTR